jgi:hypothetical protein
MTSAFLGFSFSRTLLGLSVLLLSLMLACSTAASPIPTSAPTDGQVPGTSVGDREGITPILATTVLRTGTQRVSFLLVSPTTLVKAPEATVTTRYLEGGGAVGETKQATFRLWPYAIRGAYSTNLTFDRPGRWQLDISVDDGEFSGETELVVQVSDKAVVPDIGAIPPLSQTKTLASEGGLKTLTTDFTPDPDLYLLTVEQAIKDPKPDVIVFHSPAFCTSPTCGPQVDTVAELKEAHRGEANFIHVEIYDNPDEIQGDLSQAKITGAVMEWGFDQIPGWFNESWTYVLDSEGRVHQKFEGFVTREELEETLQGVLDQG